MREERNSKESATVVVMAWSTKKKKKKERRKERRQKQGTYGGSSPDKGEGGAGDTLSGGVHATHGGCFLLLLVKGEKVCEMLLEEKKALKRTQKEEKREAACKQRVEFCLEFAPKAPHGV